MSIIAVMAIITFAKAEVIAENVCIVETHAIKCEWLELIKTY